MATAYDVYQGRAMEGVANNGQRLVRTPNGQIIRFSPAGPIIEQPEAPRPAPMFGAMSPTAQDAAQPTAQPTAQPMQMAQDAPARPRSAGGFLERIFNPQGSAKNQTIQFLTQQGLDEGTATLMAGNKQLLQQYLAGRAMPDPMAPLQMEKAQLEIENMRNPTTDDIKEYQFAVKQGYGGTLPQFMQEMKKAGATNVTTNVGGGETPGWKKIDEGFADTYLSWQSGGFADSTKMLSQLGESLKILESGQPVTGAIGVLPDILQPFINEQGAIAKEQVEEVVQRNLREILGAQFTEEEGKRLIARAYNSRLPPAENAKRVRRLIEQIGSMAEAKQSMVDFFDQNGTLRGYQGPRPSMADLDKIAFGDEGGAKPSSGDVPEFTDQKQIFEAIQNGGLNIGDVIILNGKKMRVDP